MKSTKLFFLAASIFAFSASYAQDSTHKSKSDSSKMPKRDTSSMTIPGSNGNVVRSNEAAISATSPKFVDKVVAKKEGE